MATNWTKTLDVERANKPYADFFLTYDLKDYLVQWYPELEHYKFLSIERYDTNSQRDIDFQKRGIDLTITFKNHITGATLSYNIEEKVNTPKSIYLEIINRKKSTNQPVPGWAIVGDYDILIIYREDGIYVNKNFKFLRELCYDYYIDWKDRCGVKPPKNFIVNSPSAPNIMKSGQILWATDTDTSNNTYWTACIGVSTTAFKYLQLDIIECKGIKYYKELLTTPYINLYNKYNQ